MKKLALTLCLVSLSTLAEDNEKEKQYSIGLGMGSAYTGIGANFSLISKNDLKYISAGCVEYSSIGGSTCGFGVGWIMTDLFDFDSNKHGFGVYASLVSHENIGVPGGIGYIFHGNDIYGAGVSYTFFMNGIDKAGFNFGISAHATNAELEDSYGSFLQVGYQF